MFFDRELPIATYMRIARTGSANEDFISLVTLLDANLAISDGEDHAFYNQFNGLEEVKHTVVLYDQDTPVACGAIKQLDEHSMEVKRMFTREDYRGKGLGLAVVNELLAWSAELDFKRCVLETGFKQPAAIALYTKAGFERIPNYGQYEGVLNSLCFERILDKSDSNNS